MRHANKQVGFELGISEITVKAHRGQVTRKMNAGSLAGEYCRNTSPRALAATGRRANGPLFPVA